MDNVSEFLYHTPCDECGSSDANSLYSDGHTFCFSCNTTKRGLDDMQPIQKEVSKDFITGNIAELSKRKIDLNTVQNISMAGQCKRIRIVWTAPMA